MPGMIDHVRTRPRMAISVLVGLAAGWSVPGEVHFVTRLLVGWNVAVYLLLVLLGFMMLSLDHEKLRRHAIAQAEGAATVLALVTIAAIFSVVAIVFVLSGAKKPGVPHALPHILLAMATIVGSWLLLPSLFAMNYASLYYSAGHGNGLQFPGPDKTFRPDYVDFLYFSFTIAVASQTADVAISTRSMRRLVLMQSVLSFLFNTAILAFSINIAASGF